jgi:hypothetical protein
MDLTNVEHDKKIAYAMIELALITPLDRMDLEKDLPSDEVCLEYFADNDLPEHQKGRLLRLIRTRRCK